MLNDFMSGIHINLKASFHLNESVEPINADCHRTCAIEIMLYLILLHMCDGHRHRPIRSIHSSGNPP